MTEADKHEMLIAWKSAKAKAEALPHRMRDEREQAEAENRHPNPVESYTEIRASQVVMACQAIANVPAELADIVSTQLRSCSDLGTRRVLLLSDQLYAILSAAGIGENHAPVSRQPKAAVAASADSGPSVQT